MLNFGEIAEWLSVRIARAAGVEPGEVAGNAPFDSFGITSTEAVSISGELEDLLGLELPQSLLYEHPTVDALAAVLVERMATATAVVVDSAGPSDGHTAPGAASSLGGAGDAGTDPVCVAGMAVRFPGADSVAEFWQNLLDRVDAATDVPAERWDPYARYSPQPGTPGTVYTTKGAFQRDLAGFDAAFFGISPREAARMDPQQRQLLEVGWQALENAGLAADRLRGSRTGVFVGMLADGQYATLQRESDEQAVDDPHFGIGTASSVAAGRVAYLLDLRGPALTVDTACSSSLVALHLAVRSLERGECDRALVGGVSAMIHPDVAHSACRSRMLAPDGRCKTFDATADGFLMGEGCGVIVLERLSSAVARGHQVLAVVRGSAANQDGATNGLTAPSPQAQAALIRQALADAGTDPADIGYIEAHGTGTALGDAMEMSALQEVFGGRPGDRPLVIGSVKTNIGHLLGAAGIAGVVKTVLALGHGSIPANLHLERRNPAVDWDALPTLLPGRTVAWPDGDGPRLAGVSSFGWSGSNAHVVLAQPPALPERTRSTDGRPDDWQAFLLSAHTPAALGAVAERTLDAVPDDAPALADLAHTTRAGRSALDHRAAVVVRTAEEARAALRALADSPRVRRTPRSAAVPVTFLLPGTGDLYPGMARHLYESEPAFRDALDLCAAQAAELGVDVLGALFPEEPPKSQQGGGGGLAALLGRGGDGPAGAEESPLTARTDVAHAAVFAVDHACAALWAHLGITPSALIGYSLGEYAAACLAGVFQPRDAMRLVVRRARLLDEAAEGVMLTVGLPAERTQTLLGSGLHLAAENGPMTSVVSGPERTVAALERRLDRQGVAHRRLPVAQPMHSPLLDPLRDGLTELLTGIELRAPKVPLVSNVTGTWLTDEQAVDPDYWGDHMCRTVRFGPGVGHLLAEGRGVLLELGAGQLGSLAAQVAIGLGHDAPVPVPSLPPAHRPGTEREFLVRAAARLWELGARPDWSALYAGGELRTVELPGYPFEHKRFWPQRKEANSVLPADGRGVDSAPPAFEERGSSGQSPLAEPRGTDGGAPARAKPSVGEGRGGGGEDRPGQDTTGPVWYEPVWKPSPAADGTEPVGPFLVFADGLGVAAGLVDRLGSGSVSAIVLPGEAYEEPSAPGGRYRVRPGEPADYRRLLERLAAQGRLPRTVAHLWSVTGPRPSGEDPVAAVREQQLMGFTSVTNLGRALAETVFDGVRVLVVTDLAQAVAAGAPVQPGKATLDGPRLVLSQEHRGLACRTLDLRPGDEEAVDALVTELGWPGTDTVVAHRDGTRLVRDFERTEARHGAEPVTLREKGVYLITGGLGGIGLLLAGHFARRARARLVLVGRSGLPERERWQAMLAEAPEGDPLAERVRAVLALEEQGAEVMVAAADVADPAQIRTVVDAAKRRFGALHGVVHGAGTTSRSAFAALAGLTEESVDAHFGPKVYGTLALDAALDGETLDFKTALSSMSAVLGGLGFTAYTAANAYLDARAAAGDWQSVNWDTWRSTVDPELGGSLAEFSMAPEEALVQFDLLLGDGRPRAVVAASGFEARLRRWVRGDDPVAVTPAAGPVASGPPEQGVARLAAPASGDYEARVAALWCEALGLTEVGMRDNFFDLGGDSIIGLDLIEKMKREFRCALSAVTLFEAPTVADMARYLRENAAPAAAPTPALPPAQAVPAVPAASVAVPAVPAAPVAVPAAPAASVAVPAAPVPVRTSTTPTRPITGTVLPAAPALHPAAAQPSTSATAPGAAVAQDDVAIVGMAGRFPGAADIDAFWDVLSSGTETIRFFTEEELVEAGVDPATVRRPDYVRARPVLDGIDLFDAEFFGFSAREAALVDPQQRLFLECVWQSLENAGYAPRSTGVPVGVFGGANVSTYLHRLIERPELLDGLNDYQLVVSNDKDALTLSASYRLNLRGPSVNVQTFCSTSLVALHLARRSLLAGDCDMAVAGGVSVRVPDKVGHIYEEGGMETPDGHVRTFDARAKGAVFGDGCAVVVLKRLSDALADGDTISAVIKASALNNDGNLKVGFTAPSVRGQAAVIEKAHTEAGIDPRSLGYLEAHGTATELGDPIELAALTRAFGDTGEKQYCAIGSVKTNIGHLDRAAGGAGLIKTVLSLVHRQIPPSLHYTEPNPEIDFANSPFYVNTRLAPWHSPQGTPRRAGVNSLGMGGTNAHIVLEEAPERPARSTRPPRPEVLVLSARTEQALADAAAGLARHLEAHPELPLGDVAFTLQAGRERFAHRTALTARDTADAVRLLRGAEPGRTRTVYSRTEDAPVVFVFTDLPEHPAGAAADLYHHEPEFRRIVDECTALRPELRAAFNDPTAAGPVGGAAAFLTGYALARLLTGWGARPQAVIGRGLGEYAAAVLAGVMTVDEALALLDDPAVAHRLTLRPPALSYHAADADGTLRAAAPYVPEYWTPGGRTLAEPVALPPSAQRLLVEIGAERLFATDGEGPLGRPVRVLPDQGATGDQALRDCLAELWLHGAEPDWRAHQGDHRPRRVPLPTYPFQRRSFWIGADTATAARPVTERELPADPRAALAALPRKDEAEWLYVPGWRQAPALAEPTAGLDATWLLFADEAGVAKRLAERVRADGGTAVLVRPGTGYEKTGPHTFVIDPDLPGDYVTLLDELSGAGLAPDRLVHLWALGKPSEDDGRGPTLGLYSLMYLARALAETGTDDCLLRVVTGGSYQVTGDDKVAPVQALVTGPVKTIPLEYPRISVRHLDLAAVPSRAALPRAVAAVARECAGPGARPGGPLTVALRGGRRWVPSYERVDASAEPDPETLLRRQGVYLITGGLGGIGTALAERLAADCAARLVLVGRTGLPARDDWDDLLADPATAPELARRIRSVRDLEAAGAEVMVAAADLARRDEVDKVVKRTLGRFGRIDGVFHAAGLPGEGLMALKSPEAVARVLTPKTDGTEALLAALEGQSPDFVVLFSSITAVTGGGPGQADYCSANAWLDATAQRTAPGGPRILSVNWGEWRWNAWESGLDGFDEDTTEFLRANRERIGLSFDDGWRSLLRALALPEPQVVVSTQDLPLLVDISSRLTVEAVTGQGAGTTDPAQRHPRPALATPYVAPEGERALKIAEIWAELLGLTEVGVQDSFFDLGGNSLLGMQLITRIRAAVGGSLPPHVLYEAQTIEQLLARLDAGEAGGATAGGATADPGRLDGRRARGAARRSGMAARERGTAR
ncbi:type I polyketide synthase [Streptomyces ipomoeae]|uniref:type I polyketide synthase n=1 Tax=Streptomyces ipomoeae TaxID=103232 RepID=UPI0015F03A6E|nr:type I polyketide synthase [Streptomyces ipomoeae]MDX2939092.1 type I polyketide synthase [Streptomyces ipomoeae]